MLSFPVKMDFKTTAVRRFPEVNRDLSLVIKKSVNYADIEALARKSAGSKLIGMNLFDVYEGKPLEESQKSYAVSFTLYDDEKTLTEQEIDKIMNRLMSVFENELGAWIRK
jgi:phenylalanyl-tRNA synthetase beta chain